MALRDSIFPFFAIVALALLVLLILFDDKGFFEFKALQNQKSFLVEKNEKVFNENLLLYKKIERLKNDLKFIETVARQELGMIGKDELILKLNRAKKNKNE